MIKYRLLLVIVANILAIGGCSNSLSPLKTGFKEDNSNNFNLIDKDDQGQSTEDPKDDLNPDDKDNPVVSQLDFNRAPGNFDFSNNQVVFVDFFKVQVNIIFDVSSKIATAQSRVHFYQPEEGFPVIELVPQPKKVSLGGMSLSPTQFPTIDDPDGHSKLSILERVLEPGEHYIEIEYEISGDEILNFTNDSVDFFNQCDDWHKHPYSEKTMPANFMYDTYDLEMNLKVINTQTNHRVFSNGQVEDIAKNEFKIEFDDTNSSSPYIALKYGGINVAESIYEGINGDIPITAYAHARSTPISDLNRAIQIAKKDLEALEEAFGAYPHPAFLIGLGGFEDMEWAGATMTGFASIGHELAHMWFGRGVFPIDGNAEWFDEGMATWYDYGLPSRNNRNLNLDRLTDFSPYRRDVPLNSYDDGAELFSVLHGHFLNEGLQDGLKTVMKELVIKYRGKAITNEELQEHIKSYSKASLNDFFDQHVR